MTSSSLSGSARALLPPEPTVPRGAFTRRPRRRRSPHVLLVLGASVARVLFGRDFRVTRERGRMIRSTLAPHALARAHPAALPRIPDADKRDEETRRFVAKSRAVAALLKSPSE